MLIIHTLLLQGKDPICRSLMSVTEDQLEVVEKVSQWVELLPGGVVSHMFSRVIKYDGDDDRKMTPMDVWAFMHPGFKQVSEDINTISLLLVYNLYNYCILCDICSFQYPEEMDTILHYLIHTKQFWTVYTKPNT